VSTERPTASAAAENWLRLRAAARVVGRGAEEILVFALATVVVAATRTEAEARLAEYRAYVDYEGALTLLSGWVGVDYAGYRRDELVRYVENDAGRAALENFTRAEPGREWTVGDVAEHVAIGGMGPVFCGAPGDVADAMEAFMAATGVDGFNLAYAVLPESFVDVVELLVPELQRRGVYKTEYAAGSLREKLFGRGPRLSESHPGRVA